MKNKNLILIALLLISVLSIQSCGVRKQVLLQTHIDKVNFNDKEYPTQSPRYEFNQDNIVISGNSTLRSFNVTIRNESKKSVFLVWDKVSLIYPDGTATNVFPFDKRFVNLDHSTVPMPIPPYSQTEAVFCAAKGIHWVSSNNDLWGYKDYGWYVNNIIYEISRSSKVLHQKYSPLIGQNFRIYLPLCDSNNNILYEFMLFLKVDDLVIR